MYDAVKTDTGSEFQALEEGINELAKAFFRYISNLIAKRCLVFESRVFCANKTLGVINDLISSEQMQW